jgi:hypothetical protein
LELVVEAERGPLWVRLRGGRGVKEFLKAQGLETRSANACCGRG